MSVKPQMGVFTKLILNSCAFLSLFLGIIGAFIPGLPTTPFIILSLWIFSKTSEKFYAALLSHKICGPPVKDFIEGRGIRPKYKVISLVFMWASMIASFILSYSYPYGIFVRVVLVLVACGVSYWILRTPTLKD
jgi:uncharacterized protein